MIRAIAPTRLHLLLGLGVIYAGGCSDSDNPSSSAESSSSSGTTAYDASTTHASTTHASTIHASTDTLGVVGESAATSSSDGDSTSGGEHDESTSTAAVPSESSGDPSSSDESGSSGSEGSSSSTATGDASAGDETEGPIDPPPLTYILDPYNWTPLAAVVPVRPSDFGLGRAHAGDHHGARGRS